MALIALADQVIAWSSDMIALLSEQRAELIVEKKRAELIVEKNELVKKLKEEKNGIEG